MMEGDVLVEESDDGVYRTYHDMTKPDLSVTITQALTEVDGVEINETVDNFPQYVDPDALDRLFRIPRSGDRRHDEGYIHLEIEGIDVTVHATGEIEIEP